MESLNSNLNTVRMQRIKWVDELKGTILIFICMGHLAGMIPAPPCVKTSADVLTIVGVPTFFFLSGLLYSVKDNSFRDYFIRKTKSLFVPYLLMSLLFSLLDPYTYCPQFLLEDLHYPRLSQLSQLGISSQCQASLEFFWVTSVVLQ